MPLYHFAVFVHQEDGFFFADGAAAEPSAGMAETGLFSGFQGRFGIGMGNPSAGVDGLLYGLSRQVRIATVAR